MTGNFTDKQIFELVGKAKRILLLTDERIDGDTAGSTLAMFHYLKSIGKDVRVFTPKPWSQEFNFLPGSDEVIRDTETFKQGAELMIIFDSGDGKYLQEYLPLMPNKTPLIVFDHHITNPLYGDFNQVLSDASSTGEVVWKFFKANHLFISREVATCLLTAICTDTTIFSNPNTNHVCMEAASELGLAGAKLQDVIRAFFMNKSVHALHLWGVALERLRELPGGVVMTMLSHKDMETTGAQDNDTQGIINFLIGMVADANIVCVLFERSDNSVKGSLRTLDGDVATIAQRLGGGGHTKASGFVVDKAHLEDWNNEWRIVKDDGSYLVMSDFLR